MEMKRIVLPKAERLVMRVGRNHYGGSKTFRIRVEDAVNVGAETLDREARNGTASHRGHSGFMDAHRDGTLGVR